MHEHRPCDDSNSVKGEEEDSSAEEDDQSFASDFGSSENWSDEEGATSPDDPWVHVQSPEKHETESTDKAFENNEETKEDDDNLKHANVWEDKNGKLREDDIEKSEPGIKESLIVDPKRSPSPNNEEINKSQTGEKGFDEPRQPIELILESSGLRKGESDENNLILNGVSDKLKTLLSKNTPIKEKLEGVGVDMRKEEERIEDLQKKAKMERRVTRSQRKILQRDPMLETREKRNWEMIDLTVDFEKSDTRLEEVGGSCGFVKGGRKEKTKGKLNACKTAVVIGNQ
ncbi:hypothetical protein L2E82_37658 [Cichorium intybus]|uniref:Uncharacterized protein n=1 Tax=Cichorium intybus TaxID=13427 RepID=A0ACB9AFI5_CICIN|nr:hypothetical protein L2E82_37658 [Cichorium intybus]